MDLEKLKAASISPERWRTIKIVSVCLLTALLAGFTVVTMNGDIEYTVHHSDGFGSDWDEYKVLHFGPLLQGFLGSLTMGFFLLSIYLMTAHPDRSK